MLVLVLDRVQVVNKDISSNKGREQAFFACESNSTTFSLMSRVLVLTAWPGIGGAGFVAISSCAAVMVTGNIHKL